jgi:hypothetical protein
MQWTPIARRDVPVGAVVLGPDGPAWVVAPLDGVEPVAVAVPDVADVIAMFAGAGMTAEIINDTEGNG